MIGHIVDSRNSLVELLGGEPALPEAEAVRYRRDSDPIIEDGPDVITLERLLDVLDALGDRLDVLLAGLTTEDLAREIETEVGPVALGRRIHFTYFHGPYHTGQTDLLRQVAGADDKVI